MVGENVLNYYENNFIIQEIQKQESVSLCKI